MYYDPQLITVNVILSETKPQFFYWHFNVHDERFYEHFYEDVKLFWNCWVEQKNDYYNLLQWWEIMKTQIKIVNNFWHTIHVILNMRWQILDKDISIIQNSLINKNDSKSTR